MISTDTVKRAIAGHSWLGLVSGGLMYLICLSGSLLVFSSEIEQWEQPDAPMINPIDFNVAAAETTFNSVLGRGSNLTPHMYLVPPTSDSPRARIASEKESWFLYPNGELGQKERVFWSSMLRELHYFLHLPESWGMLLVSSLGAILVGLIITGLFAHPGILRDAFALRLNKSLQLKETDIHNRLSVWAAPFHLTIAVTGAFFGLALPTLAIIAEAEFAGDQQAVIETVYGVDPQVELNQGAIAVNAILQQMPVLAGDGETFLLTVHEAESEKRFVGVSVQHKDSMIYAENYLFTTAGSFIRTDGWIDGGIGKKVLYSVYRLHFGNFSGYWVKLAYLVLGLSLTVVAASGVNVWLAKRRVEDGLSDLWAGVVWGSPLALTISAGVGFWVDFGLAAVFWLVLCSSCFLALYLCDLVRFKSLARRLNVLGLVGLLAIQVVLFQEDAFRSAALVMNQIIFCLLVGIVLVEASHVRLFKRMA